jgi:hypothetical protein
MGIIQETDSTRNGRTSCRERKGGKTSGRFTKKFQDANIGLE